MMKNKKYVSLMKLVHDLSPKGDKAANVNFIKGVFTKLLNAAEDGYDVRFGDLGTLKLVDVPARECRNPQTGEKIKIPAKKKLKFKVSAKYKGLA